MDPFEASIAWPIMTSNDWKKWPIETICLNLRARNSNWLWNSNCFPKRKVFFWLAIKDKISTRELLKRKKYGITKLQLCALSPRCRGISSSSLHGLPFCFDLLESAGACTSNSSKHVRLNSFVQNSNQWAILHRSNCCNVLGHLVYP